MIFYLLGISVLAFIPNFYALFYLLPLAGAAYWRCGRKPLVCFALGVLWALLWAQWQLQFRLSSQAEVPSMRISGWVETLPEPTWRGQRFLFKIDQVEAAQPALPSLRRIQVSLDAAQGRVSAGDHLELRLRLRSTRDLRNPYARDLERERLAQGIDALGWVESIEQQVSGDRFWPALRQELLNQLQQRFSNTPAAQLLPAIILGERGEFDPALRNLLQQTGTAHLWVVSGLHISLAVAVGWGLGRVFAVLFWIAPTWRHASRYLPPICALLMASIYAALSGWGIPVQRAWMMAAVFLLAQLAWMPISAWRRWRWALGLVVTLQPLAILQAGFWLSFSIVALLIWILQTRQPLGTTWFKQLWLSQWGIFWVMLPLGVFWFQQLNLLAPWVNLWAVPLFSIWMMSLPFWLLAVFIEVPYAQSSLVALIEGFWTLLDWSLEVFSGLSWSVKKPTYWALFSLSAAIVYFLLPLPRRWCLPPLFIMLMLLFQPAGLPKYGHFSVWILDAGQGLAVLVRTRDEVLLYDTGPGYYPSGSAFAKVVWPILQAQNIQNLDRLVISHRDLDHSGGLLDLRQRLTYQLADSGSLTLLEEGFRDCHQLPAWQSAGVAFRYLSTAPSATESENDRSCILEIRNQACALLLTGDITHAIEYDLIRSRTLQPVTWLVAAHHGSKTSSSPAFIRALSPEWAFFTAGFRNRYGHPAPSVVQSFSDQGVQMMNTAEVGAIALSASQNDCRVDAERLKHRRYWTWR